MENEKELLEIGDFDEAKKADIMSKRYLKALIRKLPESWLQKRTVTMNYENIFNMYNQRCVNLLALTEWSKSFIDWVRSLPYAQELIFLDEVKENENKEEEL